MDSRTDSQTPPPSPEMLQPRAGSRSTFALLVLANVVLCILFARMVVSALDSDEVEHAHVTWAFNHGILPYRDIHQNHLPSIWIVASPVLNCLPETAQSLVALRAFSLLAILGIYVIGLLILKEILGRVHRWQAMALLLVLLPMALEFEFYRFRPDPWMAFFSAAAILFAVRMERSPGRYAFLCGLSLGVAASFSPKMGPLCLLVPMLCFGQCIRRRSGWPLLLVIPNALGFLLGIAPVVGWIIYQGLFADFQSWCISGNSAKFLLSWHELTTRVVRTTPFLVLPILGILLLLSRRPRSPVPAWSPLLALTMAFVLALLVMVLEVNGFSYNLQTFAMPAAVLGAACLARLAEIQARTENQGSGSRRLGFAAVTLAIGFVTAWPLSQCLDRPPGLTIPCTDLQRLIDLRPSEDATCVAIVPWHPVFCRDATDLYLGWDVMFILAPWEPDAEKQKFTAMWQRAVADIEERQPDIVLGNRGDVTWDFLCRKKILGSRQTDRLLQFLRSRYVETPIDASGTLTMFVRKPSEKR